MTRVAIPAVFALVRDWLTRNSKPQNHRPVDQDLLACRNHAGVLADASLDSRREFAQQGGQEPESGKRKKTDRRYVGG